MKTVHKLVVIVGLLLAPIAFAMSPDEQAYIQADHGRTDLPIPRWVVSPVLALVYAGPVVEVGMIIDVNGQPTDIHVMNVKAAALIENVTKALAQWRFFPALREGQPTAVKVVVPFKIVRGHFDDRYAAN